VRCAAERQSSCCIYNPHRGEQLMFFRQFRMRYNNIIIQGSTYKTLCTIDISGRYNSRVSFMCVRIYILRATKGKWNIQINFNKKKTPMWSSGTRGSDSTCVCRRTEGRRRHAILYYYNIIINHGRLYILCGLYE